jgi:two-component system phosphate regulon sensor histidine kinase PhoR
LISIVNDLESISSIESGNFDLHKEKFDIVNLVKDVYELQEYRAEKKKISLELKKKNYPEIWVYGDKKRIFQVLTNLVANSINYGKEGGKTVISFNEYDKNYIIDVKDNGIGISEEHLSRIFERFYRVDKSRSRKQGGTGLGLAIVKHLIEAHNQTINIRSELGKGTSIAFTLKKV